MSLSPPIAAIPIKSDQLRATEFPGAGNARDYRRRMCGPLLAIALLLGACSGQRTASTPATTTDSDIKARSSQRVLDGVVNAAEPGCSAAVGVEGNVVWTGVRGIADLATG